MDDNHIEVQNDSGGGDNLMNSIDSGGFEILPQPDFTTCGPTCLHAMYRYYGDQVELRQVICEVESLEGGGTLSALLGCHALRRGYRARIYTYNLTVFDPTWFGRGVDLVERLREQRRHKRRHKLDIATKGYIDFLRLGGEVLFEDLTRALLRKYLTHSRPILTGLSATYLYRSAREYGHGCLEDDVRGEPVGHFVVLCGYDKDKRLCTVADPLHPNPLSEVQLYTIHIDRVISAILLGIVTYDANLLVLQP